jgi:hypothetical protein
MKMRITVSLLAIAFFMIQGSLWAQDGVLAPAAGGSSAEAHGHDHAHEAPQPTKAGGGSFKFEEETHNFGELVQGGDASWVFKFTNSGTEAITITMAKGSCGCTVPTWPQEPIQPGQSGEIAVRYDSNRIGVIDKYVTIISDANEIEKKIYIKGNITPKPAAPTFTAPPMGAPASGN